MSGRSGRGDKRSDVLVVGGGTTGLAAAIELRAGRRPPDVVVLEAGRIGEGPSARAPGLILPDLLDPWGRVARGIGEAACRELREFAAAGPAWARSRGLLVAEIAVLHVPTGAVEWEDLRETAALLGKWGVTASLEDGAAVVEAGGPRDALGGLRVPGVLLADPAALARAMADRTRAAGAEVREGVRATAIRDERDGGVLVETSGGPQRASAVIVACESAAADLLPALRGTLTPWRGQGVHAARGAPRVPLVANFGHEVYLPAADGGVEAAGLNPEPGPDDLVAEATPTQGFQRFLAGFLARRVPAAAGAPLSGAWAATTAFTPDGLPIVGAMPGRAGVLVAAGFAGRGLAWGIAAGVALAAGLAGRPGGPRIPHALFPRRFLS